MLAADACALRRREASFRVLKDDLHLFAPHARKPLEEFVHTRAGFEVLEQGPHWNAGALEKPGAADLSRYALHGNALAPVEHRLNRTRSL